MRIGDIRALVGDAMGPVGLLRDGLAAVGPPRFVAMADDASRRLSRIYDALHPHALAERDARPMKK